ncbi:MAG: SEC-C domain-containing protein, partial [Phycisphaerales bacterium]|nr:SEC-C domain-containing protein [Phycisphaerales bacterium]
RGRNKYMQGNVTIATNMAGRGTDIVLGPGVAAIGGLHVVGTERHESRRIDNQLRGRCGRQGDPGSSRFFLSLEDDLIRLFMGEFALKLLSSKLVGFEEGMAIEMRTVTRGIEKAQRKVEERNFGIRKNLLEYDEVMDHQRRTFYQMRQRVLEGRDLSELIWEMIDQVVADAVRRYYDSDFSATIVADWVSQHLGAMVPPDRLDTKDFNHLCAQVRDQAASEARSTIQQTFGEYIDTSNDPDDWDLRGLVSWAAQFGVSLTQRQARENDPEKTLETLMEAATKRIEDADLTPLQALIDPNYGRERLANWAHEKFGLALRLEDFPPTAEEAEATITEKMREAYRQREIEYPVTAALDFAAQQAGQNLNAFYERVVKWANLKFGLNWNLEAVADKDPQQLFVELRAVNEEFLRNGRMDAEIDAALSRHDGAELSEWAKQRFGIVMETYPVEPGPEARETLKRCAYEMCRYELTQLERMVMISTLDGVWKDHMYSMDLLRNSIGLRGYAERDPKIEYKREGTRLFNEMLANVRDRVTDLIFKVRLSAAPGAEAPAPTRMPQNMTESRADTTAASAIAEAARDRQAAMQSQGEGAKPKTIRRDEPKVGRNDPCPCGSGKKYKQCHGKTG